MIPVVLWGATGQARVIQEALDPSTHRVVALFDRQSGLESPLMGVPLHVGVEGFHRWLASQATSEQYWGLAAIGGAGGADRLEIHRFFDHSGIKVMTLVHPRGFVARDAVLGAGCQILAQAAVASGARLGEACIVNTGATVDHECHLGEGVHVCPGAHLAGCIEVGDFVMIGTGAVVLPRLRIGPGAIIGAGAVVLEDVKAGAVMVGNPARPLVKGIHP